tara:strand:- start:278 stop:898 length:621 start_codon:yes stop_codon:yes gene_type:complete
MKFSKFKTSLTAMDSDNRTLQILLGVAVITIFIMAVVTLRQDQRVVIQPYTLIDEAWVEQSAASSEYMESMGLFFANLLGNVTPANLSFIKSRLDPMLSASVRQSVMQALEDQSTLIITEAVVISFSPRAVIYERDSGKVFVTGRSRTEGSTGAIKDEAVTFEFGFEIDNYLPRVTSLNNYVGKPKTLEVLEQRQKLETRQKERNS